MIPTAPLYQSGLLSDAQRHTLGIGDNVSLSLAHLLDAGVDPTALAHTLASQHHLPFVESHQYPFKDTCYALDRRDLIQRHQVLPLAQQGQELLLGVSDPDNTEAVADFRFSTGLNVRLVVLSQPDLDAALRHLYGEDIDGTHDGMTISDQDLVALTVTDSPQEDSTELQSDQAPISRYIQQILVDAVRKNASDVHFEPFEQHYQIRFRQDGLLHTYAHPPAGVSRRLSTRLKILAQLNIAERRLPQDGRIKLTLTADHTVDMRVSTLPTVWGEKVVVRLLNNGQQQLTLHDLGLTEWQRRHYQEALDRPQGMILFTGPTGSGKTVSLYSGLKYLNQPERNIATIEDPVEIQLEGVNQVNVNTAIGLDFATALRAFLRQDPDVVMVGEIRDLDTAEIGIKAAQTGHLVLSTLHTNSAAESITRLAHMGIAPYNLASSLSLVVAQRLVRRLCPICKQPHPSGDPRLQFLANLYPSLTPSTLYQANPHGCYQCYQGYQGRTGVYEVLPVTEAIADAIYRNASAIELTQLATEEGMWRLADSGVAKLNQGSTSIQELTRVIQLA
ncbi:type IV-A pilus assembly ATPase PilB [Salinivibrio sp. VYel9]|nr:MULTISPECIES: type IV-A pilus assembly ATPase PilB [unclassified Salinivibrio]MPS32344.1 type IV-A pilus assembly ATPase PilB [Salinivibrio sp. VYel7]MPX90090.1 type IV-A pilus assembly ATPase PilB [Salinivibrio sp. VYel1]MPX93737.1 type IV-A pilus assembly ATPase PilB [Salinivibrio sp. VYel9]MPX96568.1 type IV-A pilus assembly ATPase PilB [Salinivibrio sp. VYel6]MPX99780.1 type IV-A pilus assembly ATPase PilB [Salinivibrio sp. VYel4]